MPQFYQTKTWQIQIPDSWRVVDKCGEEFVTLYRPDGVGMLRVFTTEEPTPDTESAEDFRGMLSGRTWVQTYGSTHSRNWVLLCRGRKLHVRYSCAAHNAEAELPEVNEIVRSIAESDPNAV